MGKLKSNSNAESDNDIDGYEEGSPNSEGSDNDESQLDMRLINDIEIDALPCDSGSTKEAEKLKTKRRLDAYLERQMLMESGWDEDDELFSDEFFTEVDNERA